MKPESMLTLFLVFSIIMIAVGGVIGDMNITYGTNVSNNWSNQYNFYSDINSSVTSISNNLQKVTQAEGWFEIGLAGAGAVLGAVGTFITMILSIPGYAIQMILGVASNLGLPDIVTKQIIPIFILMVLIAVIVAALKPAIGDAI